MQQKSSATNEVISQQIMQSEDIFAYIITAKRSTQCHIPVYFELPLILSALHLCVCLTDLVSPQRISI